MDDLNGRVALVTGSTRGIGRGIAEALADAGAAIVLNGFGSADDIEALRAALESRRGVRAGYVDADVRHPDQVAAMVHHVAQEFGQLDILVNNAGIQHTAPIEAFPDDQWDAIIAVNLSSAFHAAKAAVPGMRQRRWGRIINIASAHGLVASAHKAGYVAAKHGLVGLTKVLAIELAGTGVTANAICPGWVLTPLVEKQLRDRAQANGTDIEQEQRALVSEKQPLQEFSTPPQIGALCGYLCSDAARTMTGAALSIDGGWTAQ